MKTLTHPEPVVVVKVLQYKFMERNNENKIISEVTTSEYKYGFVSDFDSDTIDEGLSENVIKTISNKKNEPSWMLEKRLQAYEMLKTMPQPRWANIKYDEINLQNIKYYSAPTKKEKLNSLDEVDPKF